MNNNAYERDMNINSGREEKKDTSQYSYFQELTKKIKKYRDIFFFVDIVYILWMIILMIVYISSMGGGALTLLINIAIMAGLMLVGVIYKDRKDILVKVFIAVCVLVILLFASGIYSPMMKCGFMLYVFNAAALLVFNKYESYLKEQEGYPYFTAATSEMAEYKEYIPEHSISAGKDSSMEKLDADDFHEGAAWEAERKTADMDGISVEDMLQEKLNEEAGGM